MFRLCSSFFSSVCVVLIGFLKMVANGVVVMEICRDQFAIIAEVTGCSSEWQGSSCCAVFASEVASYFLRGASDGVADISPAVIESLLWAAARLVSESQPLIKCDALPKQSLSDALVRDQVSAVITDQVCMNKHELVDTLKTQVRPFAMVVTAVRKTDVGTHSTTILGDSFVVLCSDDDCVVIDSHRHNSSGTLKGYKRGASSAEAIASFVFEPSFGLLAMMGCVPTHLQVSVARPSFEPREAVGICSALKMAKYAGIVSSEPTHTIRTPYLVESEGCLFWPVTMIDTCIQEENDNGVRAHLCRVMEIISQPQRQGFQRRMSS